MKFEKRLLAAVRRSRAVSRRQRLLLALATLACGNGGLNWADVRPLIEDKLRLQPRTDGTRISGRLDSTRFASDEEFTINALYVASIEETTEVSGITGEESLSRRLRELVVLGASSN